MAAAVLVAVLVVADVMDTTTLVATAMVVTMVVTMVAIPIMAMLATELVVVFMEVAHSSSSRSRRTMVATQAQCPEREAVDVSIVVNWGTG